MPGIIGIGIGIPFAQPSGGAGPPPVVFALLIEDGSFLLLEDGSKLLLE